jgi:hypothetical protein
MSLLYVLRQALLQSDGTLHVLLLDQTRLRYAPSIDETPRHIDDTEGLSRNKWLTRTL